ncbi:hypothetical protein AZE42_08878 [Rhizopogon vesiculosus]|uniref:Uncharacterized protein n=1 Tax=Rhizopogon vesiculosus TaxID=180088 RepID=A0A1J8QC17_9AGAM|nr:hypothetical protein AZE42_08878 [Rhizopogon vesiculosus]
MQIFSSHVSNDNQIVTQLLRTLKYNSLFARVKAVGLVSSHPAACNALAKYASANLYDIDLAFIGDHAEGILASSSISYLKTAQLKGSVKQIVMTEPSHPYSPHFMLTTPSLWRHWSSTRQSVNGAWVNSLTDMKYLLFSLLRP